LVSLVHYIHMQTLATITRVTKNGHQSTWYFVQAKDGFYAFGGCNTPSIKRFDTLDQLRSLYASYIRYGYKPVIKQEQLELELA